MNLDWSSTFHYGLLVVLSLVGFKVLFSQTDLLKKVVSFIVFQSGFILLLLSLAQRTALTSQENHPFPHALALTALAATLGVALSLFALCSAIQGKYETLDSEELSKRMKP